MLHVGLTGGIGSGKSAVARMFKKRGALVLDSDRIVRELLKKGNEGFEEVLAAFGKSILAGNGSISRKKLAAKAFADEKSRKKLESILHPLVVLKRRVIIKELKDSPKKPVMVVSEAALIFEAGTGSEFDKVILVTAPEEARIRRLVKKGWTEKSIRDRMRTQWGDRKKASLADFVIDNGASARETEGQVERIWRALTKGEG